MPTGVRLNPEPHRLHHGASRCPAASPRCSRTWRRRSTSTGSSTSRAKRPSCSATPFDRRDRAGRHSMTACWRRQPGRGALPPLYLRGRRARARSSTPTPGPSSSACRRAHGFLDLVRAVYEGLAFAARDCYARHGPRARGDPRSPAAPRARKSSRRSSPRCSARRSATARARGGRRRRRRDDGGASRIGVYPDLGACARSAGSTRCWATSSRPDPALVGIYASAFPVYSPTRAGDAPGLGRPRRHRVTEPLHDRDRDHRRPLHAARRVRDGPAPRSWATASAAHARAALAGRADGCTAMPARAWTGLKEYQGEPDAIVDFVGDAEILVPSGADLRRHAGPAARAEARSPSRAAARSTSTWRRPASAACPRRQHAGPQCHGRRRVHHRRHPRRDPADPRRPRGAARRATGAAISTAPTSPAPSSPS